MGNKSARRTSLKLVFAGTDISSEIAPYILSLSYTDKEEDEADDLQIKLHDVDHIWEQAWLSSIINAALSERLHISATISATDESGTHTLPCGNFEIDSADESSPQTVLTLKATALPYTAKIRQTKKSKAWESYKLSGIASEMALANGMRCMYEAAEDPFYDRVEQNKTSDIAFLSKLCKQAGISLKATDEMLVLWDQRKYEGMAPVMTISKGDGSYAKYKFSIGTADTEYQSCRVRYTDPKSGRCISGVAKVEDYNEKSKNNQQLEIKAKVSSAAEAKKLAEKKLREHNKFERTATFSMRGDVRIVAGVTVEIKGFGCWDGKYIVYEAKHSVSDDGYTTQMQIRRVLGGY